MLCVSNGVSLGYFCGDPLKLIEDIQVLKPTIMATVPRILNRAHGKIMDGVMQQTKFKKWMFNKAVETKTQ